MFQPPALVPLVLSTFLAEHVTGQLRLLILVAPCWMEAPWLHTVLSMLADVPWNCPVVKDVFMDVSVGQVLKGLPYPFGCSEMCVAQTGVLFLSLSDSEGGTLSIYNKCLPAVLERMGRLLCSRGGIKQCNTCPYISKFFGLGIQLVFTFLLF